MIFTSIYISKLISFNPSELGKRERRIAFPGVETIQDLRYFLMLRHIRQIFKDVTQLDILMSVANLRSGKTGKQARETLLKYQVAN